MSFKTLIVFTVAITMFAASPSYAQYDLNWVTVDCGGGTSSGGGFLLSGTIGQHDAGAPLSGGGFIMLGGFWPAGPTLNTCPADIAPSPNGDGEVNINDLLAVISAWGPCPIPPSTCPADIAPPGGDDIVNIDDLLAIISNWGTCP